MKEQTDREISDLLNAIRKELPGLKALLEEASSHWGYEDPIYRFYHQSFKLYHVQSTTEKIVQALQALAPQRQLNEWFAKIIKEGTGRQFELSHNKNWLLHARPILEAFFHARHLLAMVCKYGDELTSPPSLMPSGWATVLYLYNLR